MPEPVIDVSDLLFPPNPSIKRSLIALIGGFTRFFLEASAFHPTIFKFD
jgi:hypothetical protein